MRFKSLALRIVLCTAVLLSTSAGAQMIGINVVLKTSPNAQILADLGTHGKVRDIVPEIKAVTVQAKATELPAIQKLSYVAAANPDQPRGDVPLNVLSVSNFANGINTWNLDAVNVTDFRADFTPDRTVAYDGSGTYAAVLDTGLLKTWPYYFPTERIATQYARCFGGGGGDMGFVSAQPNKWEEDQSSHGTHVTSTILGYNMNGVPVNGVAPRATVIPVKVLNQNGHGWSSVIARGITYIADLKAEELSDHPIVINMSLGGPSLDAMEKAAIDYAISKGVIVVAAAGNTGAAGMHYPGAYAPVIAVAAAGWVQQRFGGSDWWYAKDVPDPTDADDYYIASFSGIPKTGQEVDVAAPGVLVVGPYQVNGQISYYFLNGTSMATPHISGIVALMAQKDPALTAGQVQDILRSTATGLPDGCRDVFNGASFVEACWTGGAGGAGLANAEAALGATP